MIDEERKERFLLAIKYLQKERLLGVKTLTRELVEKTGYDPTNIYKAKAGHPKFLTQNFVNVFCMAFDGIISPEWIWDGVGDMVCVSNELYTPLPEISDETLSNMSKEQLVELVKQLMVLHAGQDELYRMMIRQNEEMIRNGQSRFNDITKIIYKNA